MPQGDTFPAVPRGFTWKPLSAYAAEELRERAAYYRRMAATASTDVVSDRLVRLAERFDELAARRERQD